MRSCLVRNPPGPYQLQAAIAAVHTDAATADATDWDQIVAIYDHLLRLRTDQVVALNRVIAVMEQSGPGAALDALEAIDLPGYHLYHATRAEVLRRAGRTTDAAEALERALDLTSNTVERRHLERQLALLH